MYLKQNKLRKAEYHFRKAIEISPSNAVLIHCEGTVSPCSLLPTFYLLFPEMAQVTFSEASAPQLRYGAGATEACRSDSWCCWNGFLNLGFDFRATWILNKYDSFPIAQALEKRGELEQALERYNRSLALSPLSPLVKFKRVKVLIQLKQYEVSGGGREVA